MNKLLEAGTSSETLSSQVTSCLPLETLTPNESVQNISTHLLSDEATETSENSMREELQSFSVEESSATAEYKRTELQNESTEKIQKFPITSRFSAETATPNAASQSVRTATSTRSDTPLVHLNPLFILSCICFLLILLTIILFYIRKLFASIRIRVKDLSESSSGTENMSEPVEVPLEKPAQNRVYKIAMAVVPVIVQSPSRKNDTSIPLQ